MNPSATYTYDAVRSKIQRLKDRFKLKISTSVLSELTSSNSLYNVNSSLLLRKMDYIIDIIQTYMINP